MKNQKAKMNFVRKNNPVSKNFRRKKNAILQLISYLVPTLLATHSSVIFLTRYESNPDRKKKLKSVECAQYPIGKVNLPTVVTCDCTLLLA